MLLVPEPAQLAVRVLELQEHLQEVAVARTLRPVALALPVVAKAVDGDGPKPAAERAGPLMLEFGDPADDDGEDVLNQVVGVAQSGRVPAEPAADQRRVQLNQALPVRLPGVVAQSIEQADGRFGHAVPPCRLPAEA